ncbi:MAG: hypothetical protein WCD79_02620 [Chthoniobacteraceae bacterium]
MEIQIASLCDSAADYNGKLCIIGTFDTIMSHTFPFSHPQCSVALRMTFRDDDEGHFALKINIVDEDGQPVVPPIEGGLDVKIPDDSSFLTRNGVFNLQHLKFDRPGFYSVDVVVNGRTVAGIPFRIVQFQPPIGEPLEEM